MAEVVLNNVRKMYPGGIHAVNDFSLNVKDGELVVLVGPSGSGKTSVLRLIAGLEKTNAGTISIDGRVVNDVPPRDRNVAMVFQNFALFPHLTVCQNMGFALKLRAFEKKEIAVRVREAAEMLGITDLLDRRPGTLSGGQRQRVAVGCAIVCKPAVFLLDEPLSNLDAKLRLQMRVEISRLHSRLETTMVYVTHDQTEALTIGQRIAVMKDGTIQQVADPVTLYDRPANRFVAGFIGMPPMNLLQGRITSRNGEVLFSDPGGFMLPLTGKDIGQSLAGKTVTLGLRPEDINVVQPQHSQDTPGIEADVELVEPVGPEACIHFNAGGTNIVGRTGSHAGLRIGDRVSLAINASKACVFDETGRAIL
jgi:multiple sugar transport system ATP-binding protein